MAGQTLPEFDNLRVSVAGARADIVLARPEKLNPLDWTTVRSLKAASRALEAMDDVRVVVIRGSGKAFSAGATFRAISTSTPRRSGSPSSSRISASCCAASNGRARSMSRRSTACASRAGWSCCWHATSPWQRRRPASATGI